MNALRFALVFLIGSLLSLGQTPDSSLSPLEERVDYVAATVDGEPIPWSAVLMELRWRNLPTDDPARRREALNLLIDQELFLGEAKNFIVPKDGLVEQELRRMAQPMELDRFLAAQTARGIEEGYVRERAREQSVLAELVEREFRPKIHEASPTDVEAYYTENAAEFIAPERFRVEQMLFPFDVQASQTDIAEAMTRLGAAREALLAGDASPDELAARATGIVVISAGEPTPISRFAPEFQETLRALPVGEWSEPTRVAAGAGLIRVVERIPAARVPLTAELRGAIARAIQARRLEDAMEAWLKERKSQADIRILDPALAPAEPGSSPSSSPQKDTSE